MAHYQRVEYRIGTDGRLIETVIEGDGSDCLDATLALEHALGEVESREWLPEYEADNPLELGNTQSLNSQY